MESSRKIRLTESHLKTIKLLALKYFDTEEVKIFGSRTDLNKKGGDIDIYIRTDKSDNILKSKIAFLRDFEKIHGEQKIDLIIQSSKSSDKKIFKIARKLGIKI